MTTPLTSVLAKDWTLEVDTGTSDLASHTAAGVASTDVFTLNAHGLVDGQALAVTSGPTGVTAATVYYVRDSSTNTFKLAASAGAAAVDVTADGNLVYVEGPVWTKVRGLTKIAPGVESNSEDDSDFDSDGWGSDVVTQRKWKIECEGRRKRAANSETFVADPGQEAVRIAGELIGFGGTVHVRWYRRDGAPDAYEGYASVDYSGGGGAVNGLEPLSFTLMGQGARTSISNPTAA